MREEENIFFDDAGGWDKDGAAFLLHAINPLRLKLTRTATGGLAGKRLFDLGCGGGIFSEAAAAGARVVAVDIAAGAIAAAFRAAAKSGSGVDYRVHSGFADGDVGAYDVVTCFEMLEHADNPAAVVADVSALLAPGGTAVFSTINRGMRSRALMIAGLEKILNILPSGVHDYEKFIPPADLAGWCQDAGLSVRRVVGMRYSFFGRVYLLDDADLSVNYFLIARRDN